MIPIYRSPDQDQTQAMQSLLLDHKIQTSVIETKKTSNATNSTSPTPVTWYELWLRDIHVLTRAKTIITQHEFTTFRTSMYSYRTSTQSKKEDSDKVSQIAAARTDKLARKISLYEKSPEPKPVISDPAAPSYSSEKVETSKPREDLIPINNKRVFRRLGRLLGFSEEEIQQTESDNNTLYRPWDADELNESVKKLKQKCS